MSGIELDGVAPHEVDDDSSPFKRSVALIAALILLLGAIVAFLKDDATGSEDRLAAEAQSQAIEALGLLLAGNTTWESAQKRSSEHKLLQTRAFEARRHNEDDRAGALLAAADQLRESSSFLSSPEYASDPYWPNRFLADTFEEPSRLEYARQATAESADSWGARADAFGAILTLLAAALFLLGLSLIARVGRYVFLTVGILIALVGVTLTVGAARRHASATPTAAVDALAEGERLAIMGDYERAIDAYSRAISLRGDFAVAYFGRAVARWQLAADSDPREPYIAKIGGTDLELTMADARAAEANGAVDAKSLNLLAALLIHDEEYKRAEALLARVVREDDSLAVGWANLGAARVGRGDADGASAAYQRAIELSAEELTWYHRTSLDASTRSVLEEVGTRNPEQRALATQMSTAITVAQLRAVLGPWSDEPQGAVGDGGLSVERRGVELVAKLQNTFPAGAPAAFVWYRRTGPDSLWVQPTIMSTMVKLSGTGSDVISTSMGLCPVPGDYRVDVIVGSSVAASSDAFSVAPSPGALMYEEDRSAGASMCRPSNWHREESRFDLVVTDADTGTTVRVGAERRQAAGQNDATRELDEILAAQLGSSYELIQPARDVTVGGLAGRYELRRSSIGNIGFVFAALDGELVRIVVTEAPAAMGPVLDEVVSTMRFVG